MSAPPQKPEPSVRSLSCPNCGGSVQVRGLGRTMTVVCIQCLSILDASAAGLRVLQQFQAAERYQPIIPLGTRGKMPAGVFEAIGFQVREMQADGVAYHWSEYVLFNPYKGFRYLTEYNGHWNDVTILRGIPITRQEGGRPVVIYRGATYRHFQNYRATTTYVMGEFPWKVRVGEVSACDDFICPPYLLSKERTDNEITWSIGEYTPPATIWKYFQLKGDPPLPAGIFANQPGPNTGSIGKAWGTFAFWFLALLFIQLTFAAVLHSSKTVFSQKFSFTQQVAGGAENSFVTEVFDVPGRISNLEVELKTDLNNNWSFFQLALINAETSTAYDFSRQVEYYTGRDSDGSWSEGRAKDSVVLASIPPGKYYLRVEPEMDTSTSTVRLNSLRYEIKVIRDVTTWAYFWIGALLLLIPPIWTTIRRGSFETQRWAESDYAGATGGSASGSDDE